MQWLMFLALSAIAAILFGPVNGWLNSQATSRLTSPSAQNFLGSYSGRTAVTTAAFFFVLLAAATVMSVIGKSARIPEVV